MRQLEIDFGPDPPRLPWKTILLASFERVRRRYFRGRFPGGPQMRFGLLRASSFRTIGRAEIDDRRILVHPGLFHSPWYGLLDFVMYHEMLHFSEYRHNQRFKTREKRFARFDELTRLEGHFYRHLENLRRRRSPAGRHESAAGVDAVRPARRTSPRSPRCAASP